MAKRGSSHDDDPFAMSYINDDDESFNFGPCNMQQETNTYGTDDSMLVFPAVDNSHAVTMNNSPYSVLFPLLKELTPILEGNCSINRLERSRKHKIYFVCVSHHMKLPCVSTCRFLSKLVRTMCIARLL